MLLILLSSALILPPSRTTLVAIFVGTPVSSLCQPARSGEALLLIANFDDSKAKSIGFDAPNRIYSLITSKLTPGTSSPRVEKYNRIIGSQDEARRVLKDCQATLLVWGWYGDAGAQANVELDKGPIKSVQADFMPATPESFHFKNVAAQTAYLTFFSLGMLQLNAGLDAAQTLFTAAIDSAHQVGDAADPWEALMWRGIIYGWSGKYDLAIADHTEALRLHPNRDGYFNRAYAYIVQGKYAEALADYDQAIQIAPQDKLAYVNRGSTYHDQGKYAEALADYSQALQIDPRYEEAYVHRGAEYGNQGKYAEALADFDEALKIDPRDKSAYACRGTDYENQGKYAEALADFDEALKIDPNYAEARTGIGDVYADQHIWDKAIPEYRAAIKLNPQYPYT